MLQNPENVRARFNRAWNLIDDSLEPDDDGIPSNIYKLPPQDITAFVQQPDTPAPARKQSYTKRKKKAKKPSKRKTKSGSC